MGRRPNRRWPDSHPATRIESEHRQRHPESVSKAPETTPISGSTAHTFTGRLARRSTRPETGLRRTPPMSS